MAVKDKKFNKGVVIAIIIFVILPLICFVLYKLITSGMDMFDAVDLYVDLESNYKCPEYQKVYTQNQLDSINPFHLYTKKELDEKNPFVDQMNDEFYNHF